MHMLACHLNHACAENQAFPNIMLFLMWHRNVVSFDCFLFFLSYFHIFSLAHRRSGELSGQAEAPGGDSQEAETGGPGKNKLQLSDHTSCFLQVKQIFA